MLFILLMTFVVSACTATCHSEHGRSDCKILTSDKSKNLTTNLSNETILADRYLPKFHNSSSSPLPYAVKKTPSVWIDLNLQVIVTTSSTIKEEDASSDNEKIISIIIPFASIIGIAVVLVIIYRLVRVYNCCNNKACLDRCSAFCDACVSTPYVYQPPCHQNQLSSSTVTPHKHAKHKKPATIRLVTEAKAVTLHTIKIKTSAPVKKTISDNSGSVILQQPKKV
ncbi:hypothetical protein Btru_020124 [Bulinus truncatus]|nr:hypothetical protein Btru_020124 [Bulinus truncatus]